MCIRDRMLIPLTLVICALINIRITGVGYFAIESIQFFWNWLSRKIEFSVPSHFDNRNSKFRWRGPSEKFLDWMTSLDIVQLGPVEWLCKFENFSHTLHAIPKFEEIRKNLTDAHDSFSFCFIIGCNLKLCYRWSEMSHRLVDRCERVILLSLKYTMSFSMI